MRDFGKAAIFATYLLISGSALAHHGNAAYDESRMISVKATVTEWVWANPHCWLMFDTTDDKGNVVHWKAETSNPPDMINRGWTKQTLKPGDQITVTMITVKNGQPIGRVRQVILPDGRALANEGGLNSKPITVKPVEDAPKP